AEYDDDQCAERNEQHVFGDLVEMSRQLGQREETSRELRRRKHRYLGQCDSQGQRKQPYEQPIGFRRSVGQSPGRISSSCVQWSSWTVPSRRGSAAALTRPSGRNSSACTDPMAKLKGDLITGSRPHVRSLFISRSEAAGRSIHTLRPRKPWTRGAATAL